MNLALKRLVIIFSILLILPTVNGIRFLLAPSIFANRSIARTSDLREILIEGLQIDEGILMGSFTISNVTKFEEDIFTDCYQSYGAEVIICDLSLIWNASGGLMNLIDPPMYLVYFHFDSDSKLVDFNVRLINYFVGVYYDYGPSP